MSLLTPRADSRFTPPTFRLIVLAKEPVAGRVKTRLTPAFSAAAAAELAAAAIADTLSAVMALVAGCRRLGYLVEPVLALDGRPGPWLDSMVETSSGLAVIPQRTGSLNARIAGAFEDAGSGAAGALLIGMDTPQLTGRLLADAFDALGTPGCDAVLGLADDGGWWAMGLRQPDERLLSGVPMSTPETGRRQHAQLLAAGLSVTMLPRLRDVDTAEDAEFVAALAPQGRFATTLAALSASRALALPAYG